MVNSSDSIIFDLAIIALISATMDWVISIIIAFLMVKVQILIAQPIFPKQKINRE